MLLVAFCAWVSIRPQPATGPTELVRFTVPLHEGRLDGSLSPDSASTTELAVDRYFKANAPFKVHCPPRSDVNFAVEGASVRSFRDQQQMGFIVGKVNDIPVSILILDRAILPAFPSDQARLTGGRHHSPFGGYATVSAVVADNVVDIVGNTKPEFLAKLLDAYGSYH
jgi:hypothetical protein